MDDQTKWRGELQHPSAEVRASAAENLCLAGPSSAAASVDLVAACGDETETVRSWAAAALEDIGPPPIETLKPLSELVSSTNPLVAYWAVTLLGRLGAEASEIQDGLAKALRDSNDAAVQERSAWALGKIGATSNVALAALQQAASSDNQRLARLADTALPQSEKH